MVAWQAVFVVAALTRRCRQDGRPVASRVHLVVGGHGTGRVRHGQLHVVLLSDVPARPIVLPERRAAGGHRVPDTGIPRVQIATMAVATEPQLRDGLHTGGIV